MSDQNNSNFESSKNGKNTHQKVNFDDVLPLAGEFGFYQVYLFVLTIPFYFYLAFVYNGQLFLTETSDKYWCRVPELEHLTSAERISLAIPPLDSSRHGYSQCTKYKANWTQLLANDERPTPDWDTEPCHNGWEFNATEMYYPTVASELGWVCDKDSYQATAQAIFFVGSIFGGILLGSVSDRFGRLPALIASNLISCIGGVATYFSVNFSQFVVSRFVVGIGYDNVCTMMYILVLEYTAPKYRSVMANISFALIYCLATCLMPWIAIMCGHWRIFSLVTSLPLLAVVFTKCLLPESPRWLLSTGKVEQTAEILQKIAKVNKRQIPEEAVREFKKSASNEETEKKMNLLQLRGNPAVLKMLLLQGVLYVTADVAFDAIVRMSGKIGYDFAMSFTLSSLTEFPSLMLLMIILDRWGRRFIFVGSMAIAAICCVLVSVVDTGVPSVCCCVLARFFVNMGHSTSLQWAIECLPTEIRGSGISVIHIAAYVAVILSPYIVYLETVHTWLPLVLVGAILLAGALSALFLPETCGKALPQNLLDSELLMRQHSVWSLSLPHK